MFQIRRAGDRGHAKHGWLDTWHTFSFADYYDASHMGFRSLRVINEDWVAPDTGFGMHPHRDMEIITYILEGELEHRDSLGNGSVLRPGELQHMTAGTGIMHSEFNPSKSQTVHLYQIWLLPRQKGLPPRYDQRVFPVADRINRWQLVASPTGAEGSFTIEQDARVHLAKLDKGNQLDHELAGGRAAWLQVLRGQIEAGGHPLQAGDGLTVGDEKRFQLAAASDSEVMLFDLA